MHRRHIVASLALFATLAAGCGSVPKRTEVMSKLGVKPTTRQLRARMNDLALAYNVIVQRTADDIRSQFRDSQVQLAALQWKVDATGLGTMAFFRTDPLIAYFDAWLLTVQMRRFFERSGNDTPLKGGWRLAVHGCRQMEERFAGTSFVMGKPEEGKKVQAFIERWADDHPLHDLRLSRDSIEPFLERLVTDTSVSIASMAGEMPDLLEDISFQTRFYMWLMPKQMRSETQLFLEGFESRPETKQLLASLHTFATLAGEMGSLLRGTAQTLHRERKSLSDLLAQQRDLLFEEVNRQRVETMEVLRQERAVILQALHSERVAMMQDAEGMAGRTVDRGISQSYSLIDRVFLRLVEVMVVAGLGALLAWWLFRRRQMYAGQRPRMRHDEPAATH